MIKFFRKIRKNLLSEGKIREYLKYVVGEIILLVIGILIAFSIDNWNEENNQLAHGQTIMFELIEEINDDIKTYNRTIDRLENCINIQESIFKVKDLKSLSTDSLKLIFYRANFSIEASTSTYEKIKNQKLPRLSTDASLNNNINIYFNLKVDRFNNNIDFYWEMYLKRLEYLKNHNMANFNSNMVQGYDEVSDEVIRQSLIEFINLPRTKSTIDDFYYDSKNVLEIVKKMKIESISLLEQLHNYLSETNPKMDPLPDFD